MFSPVLPSIDAVKASFAPSDTTLRARDGRTLQVVRVDHRYRQNRWVSLSELPTSTLATVLASEDRRFAYHRGVDIRSLARSLLGVLRGQPRGGASTISMQTVNLISRAKGHSGPKSSVSRKVWQILAALQLEQSWSKSEILEAYLNLVPFRGELRGIGAASRELFDVQPQAISPVHAIILASLLPAPNAAKQVVEKRACRLAQRLSSSVPDCSAIELSWKKSDAALLRAARHGLTIPAARSILTLSAENPARKIKREVFTTLDLELQSFVFDALRAHLAPLRDRFMHDGAVIVVHNRSGEVLAYVPNSGNAATLRHVDGILARRQAGSTLKPFIYAKAFEENLIRPGTLLSDSSLDISEFNGLYRPANYDRQFRGVVTAREALASSLNIPAVRILELVGVTSAGDVLTNLQLVNASEVPRYGLSLALGAPSVRLWDLANAYRTLANEGGWSPLRIERGSSKVERRTIFSADASAVTTEILSDREARRETFGLASPLATTFWSAVKTGTSKDMTDNWCIGFSQDYTVGVWVGNFSGAPMRNVSGITGAAPLWSAILHHLHRDRSVVPHRPSINESDYEQADSRAKKSQSSARITYPAQGTSVALDPDMPGDYQAILFTSRFVPDEAIWQLNGESLGSAHKPVAWHPRKGTHVLRIVRPHSVSFPEHSSSTDWPVSTLDSVRFSVR